MTDTDPASEKDTSRACECLTCLGSPPRVSGGRKESLKSGRFGEIHPESIPPALISPGHLRRRMTELLLYVTLVDFS